MKRIVSISLALVCSVILSSASDYKSKINSWKGPEDVGKWLKNNWNFDKSAQPKGKSAITATVKSAEETYNDSRGWCKDAANFANETLNKMDAKYKAEYIFIENKIKGKANHWVTGFKKDGKLYVMDYGAGHGWNAMMGLHGPYDSIKEYADFLRGINAKGFKLDFVAWMKLDKTSNVSKSAMQRAKIVLRKFDKNNDGQISFKEAPGKMKANFERLDSDGNEGLNEVELQSLPPRG